MREHPAVIICGASGSEPADRLRSEQLVETTKSASAIFGFPEVGVIVDDLEGFRKIRLN